MKKICVGVSGGADSAATVLMLKDLGYDVVGINFVVSESDGGADVATLQDSLQIPITSISVAQQMERLIINPFVESYMSGRTPSPCVDCNGVIKWQTIQNFALANGINSWATGHYCQKEEKNNKYYISKGLDPIKDQSYYLWRLSQETIRGALMPLGGLTKGQVRDYLDSRGLHSLAHQKESMGICFLGKGGYSQLLRERVADIDSLSGGEIVDEEGNFLAYHQGFPFYTLAQKKGLNIVGGLSVIEIDAASNRLIVGNSEKLLRASFYLNNLNIIDEDEFFGSKELEVKVRGVGRNPKGFCRVTRCEEGKIKVDLLDDAAWAICKGQPAVFYIANRVVGGGCQC